MSETSDTSDKDVGEEIKSLREAAGLSQGQLAELAGTNQQTVQRIESGATSNSRATPRLLRALRHLELRTSSSTDDLARAYMTAFDRKAIKKKIVSKQDAADKIGVDVNPNVERVELRKSLRLHFSNEVEPGVLLIDNNHSLKFDLFDFVSDFDRSFAMYVPVSDMEPEFEPGDILLIDAVAPPIPNVTCLFCGREERKTLVTIKRLISSSSDKWHVRSWSPLQDATLSKADWPVCMRVAGKFSRR